MGLTWGDQPTRSGLVVGGGHDRIIDLRTPSGRRRSMYPDPVDVAAIRWTVFGFRCSIEVSRGEGARALGELDAIPSGT